MFSPLRPLFRRACDLVWPPQCPVSGQAVDDPGHLAVNAWRDLTFLAPPQCSSCGRPFEYAPVPEGGDTSQEDWLCGVCLAHPPRFDSLRAPLAYDEASSALVLAFKKADRVDMLPQFGRWMRMAARRELDAADLAIPVPLHWRRLLARRYNQAALLARALVSGTSCPVRTDILVRKKATPSQAGRSASGRRRNMVGAFAVRKPDALSGRRVLLVDDVYTTGATIAACTRLLKLSGAIRVDVVTLCKVVREETPPT